ncbi:UDP-N-acetylmuramoyl-tripeptide--D-alanyl-D-alanine ligase [bacterium]|nr:UDP-N-acetylmuramoyl-tripeptide--D-alanyl-D-alanine ligase [bacterium]
MTERRADILFTAGEAAGMIGGACRGNLGAAIRSVAADSRKAEAGTLFVAMPGENVDGHDYIVAALRQGAACVLAAAGRKEKVLADIAAAGLGLGEACLVFVDSPLAGLQALAREHRRRMKGLLRIGVTGSSGKTTTKECIAMNEGNLNSDIGLALSMFSLSSVHKVGVFEMGMNRVGEMDELAAIYEPDIGVITNIGVAHIGLIGSREGIAAEKKKIFSRFTGAQRGFVWDGDAFKDFLKEGVRGKVSEFGLSSTVGLEGVESRGLEGWKISWQGRECAFPLPGRHNLLNALAALSVAAELGLDPALAAAGLSSVKPLFGRSEIFSGPVSLVRDCYNANPDSVAAAIDFCDSVEWAGRKIYVLGSMRELGSSSAEEHAAMGRRAAASSADAIFFFGDETKASLEAAFAAKSAVRANDGAKVEKTIFHTNDLKTLVDAVLGYLREGDLVLAKASRGLALERFTDALFAAGLVKAPDRDAKTGAAAPKGGAHAS